MPLNQDMHPSKASIAVVLSTVIYFSVPAALAQLPATSLSPIQATLPQAISRNVPFEAAIKLETWMSLMIRWTRIHYTVGIVGTLIAATVAARPTILKRRPRFFNSIGWLSVLCIASLTFLQPSKKAKVYFQAWQVLDDACNRYRIDAAYDIKQVLDAMDKGDKILAASDAVP
jgi:hypothetical protein